MYEVIVIGASAGGIEALKTVLSGLPSNFTVPIAIVQHIGPTSESSLAECLSRETIISVKEGEDKETLNSGTAYLAPPGYHLLIDIDRNLSLSVDPRVNFSCPAIDVLFESAADAFQANLIGIVLTGANTDGAQGLKTIQRKGGLTIVQNPETAKASYMPRAAIDALRPDYILDLENIAPLLVQICQGGVYATGTND